MILKTSYHYFYESLLKVYMPREARQISDWVFEKVTGRSSTARIVHAGEELEPQQEKQLEKMLLTLLDHVPLQYVLKEAWFFKRSFYVDQNVLIPRPETEELVEWALKDVKEFFSRGSVLRLLDIGTGSGCIAIALKKEHPLMEVWALDQSERALAVARKNAQNLQADICFLEADFLRKGWEKKVPKLDILVSNPPYIPIGEKTELEAHVAGREPDIALFVPDADPFIFYKAILYFAQKKLNPGGRVYVEIHENHGKEVKQLFEKTLKKVTLKKDLNGRDRMISGVFEG